RRSYWKCWSTQISPMAGTRLPWHHVAKHQRLRWSRVRAEPHVVVRVRPRVVAVERPDPGVHAVVPVAARDRAHFKTPPLLLTCPCWQLSSRRSSSLFRQYVPTAAGSASRSDHPLPAALVAGGRSSPAHEPA